MKLGTLLCGPLLVATFVLTLHCGGETTSLGDTDASAPSNGSPPVATVLEGPKTVTATTDRPDSIVVRWVGPTTGSPTSFVVLRDRTVLATVAATSSSFEDTAASAPTLGEPLVLTASDGTRSDGVELSWRGALTGAGKSHGYRIVANYATGDSAPSTEALGSRLGVFSGYDLSRDGGATWKDVGTATTILDGDAPRARLQFPTPIVGARAGRNYVKLSLAAYPTAAPMPATTYRVRARARTLVGAPSNPAVGKRASGIAADVPIQWQRSSGASDGGYSDLPDVTGREWLDDSGPATETRFYRARASADWTEGESPAVSSPPIGYKSVVVGYQHSCGIRMDDKVVCWGQEGNRPVSELPSADSFRSLAIERGTCGVRLDGKVVCWGDNSAGQAPPGPSLDSYKSISVGSSHSCGIRTDNKLVCWGTNAQGEVPSIPAESFKSVAVGVEATCAIRSDDQLVCWGRHASTKPTGAFRQIASGDDYLCGIRTTGNVVCWGQSPTSMADVYKAVAPGRRYTCAIRPDDKVECFGGSNYHGQAPALTEERFKSVSAGSNHTCGIRLDDKVVCWGDNEYGSAPSAPTVGSYTAVAIGDTNVCAIRTDGKMRCAGHRYFSQAPVGVTSNSFGSVGMGHLHTCGIRTDGSAECWGTNAGTPPMASFKVVTAGRFESCGIRTDDTATCWGYASPSMPPPDRFASIAGGKTSAPFGCGVRLDGKIVCWGTNELGQAPPSPTVDTFTSVAAGDRHSCGVRADGKVVCWGSLPEGFPTGPTTDTFSGVAVGSDFTCGLRADRKIVCWGQSYANRFPESPTLDSYRYVAAGLDNTCAIRMDNKLICWGPSQYGQAPPL
jgi:alpha-tubulin suppressor-like RCC1 family protein